MKIAPLSYVQDYFKKDNNLEVTRSLLCIGSAMIMVGHVFQAMTYRFEAQACVVALSITNHTASLEGLNKAIPYLTRCSQFAMIAIPVNLFVTGALYGVFSYAIQAKAKAIEVAKKEHQEKQVKILKIALTTLAILAIAVATPILVGKVALLLPLALGVAGAGVIVTATISALLINKKQLQKKIA